MALIFGAPAILGSPSRATGDFASENVDLVSQVPLSSFPSLPSTLLDVEAHVSGAGRLYAMIGLPTGVAWVDLFDPANPQVVAELLGSFSPLRDSKSFGDLAYLGDFGTGTLSVVDLSQIDVGLVTPIRDVVDGGPWSTLSLAVDSTSGFLYRAGLEGIQVFDLNDPTDPLHVASWSERSVSHLQVGVWGDGREIAVCASGDAGGFLDPALEILDVSDKANIQTLARVLYPNRVHPQHVSLDVGRHLAFLVDDFDEDGVYPSTGHVFDLSADLTQPVWVSSFSDGSLGVSNQIITKGPKVMMASWRSGLRVFDARDPQSVFDIGFFDTVIEDDDLLLSGLGSVAAFENFDLLIGGDSLSGLLVWELKLPELEFQFPQGIPLRLDPRGGTRWEFQILDQVEFLDPSQVVLYLDVGSGFQSLPVTDLGGGRFESIFPAIPCGDKVSFYLEGTTFEGTTLTYPEAGASMALEALATYGNLIRFQDEFEAVSGWTVGASDDDALAGHWVMMDPESTSAQPEDDHTEHGTLCWVTDGRGGSLGQYDVDGGKTSLTSPRLSLARASDPLLSFWLWYDNSRGNAPESDTFEVIGSSDNGATWNVLLIIGPTGPEVQGGWNRYEIRLRDVLELSNGVRLRFVASDVGEGSIVEAALDDVRIDDISCPGETLPSNPRDRLGQVGQ